MDHPPYSPDLSLLQFFGSFKKLRNALKGQGFADTPDIQRNVTTLLRGIQENAFQACSRQWHHRLMKCIASEVEHLEGHCSR
jgi:hypothetical protein